MVAMFSDETIAFGLDFESAGKQFMRDYRSTDPAIVGAAVARLGEVWVAFCALPADERNQVENFVGGRANLAPDIMGLWQETGLKLMALHATVKAD